LLSNTFSLPLLRVCSFIETYHSLIIVRHYIIIYIQVIRIIKQSPSLFSPVQLGLSPPQQLSWLPWTARETRVLTVTPTSTISSPGRQDCPTFPTVTTSWSSLGKPTSTISSPGHQDWPTFPTVTTSWSSPGKPTSTISSPSRQDCPTFPTVTTLWSSPGKLLIRTIISSWSSLRKSLTRVITTSWTYCWNRLLGQWPLTGLLWESCFSEQCYIMVLISRFVVYSYPRLVVTCFLTRCQGFVPEGSSKMARSCLSWQNLRDYRMPLSSAIVQKSDTLKSMFTHTNDLD